MTSDGPNADDRHAATGFAYTGPEALREPIEQALRRVIDPEIALSIVDVGLIYAVDIVAQRLHLRMTMTSAACPVADVILDDIDTELDRVLPEGMQVELEMVWDPPWTPERLSPEARIFMGW
ncbi:MAG: metal-sulfur cluster assembly factor [Burkholderiales bacterium]|nr:metal-sulfur cluster assembly factor [Burkholderiales bacterium]